MGPTKRYTVQAALCLAVLIAAGTWLNQYGAYAAEHRRLNASGIRVHAIPDQFIDHGPQAYQRAKFHLDAAGIADTVLDHYPELERSASRNRPRAVATQKETVTW